MTQVSQVFKPKDENAAKGAENEGPKKGRNLPPALDVQAKFRGKFKDEVEAEEEEKAYEAQNDAVENTAEVSPKTEIQMQARGTLGSLATDDQTRITYGWQSRQYTWRTHGYSRKKSL